MKTKQVARFFLVLILCLGIGPAASTLYAQKKRAYGYGDTGIPHDYFDKMKDLRKEKGYFDTLKALPASYISPYTPAKSQGTCGSCWAFTSVGVIEAHALRQYSATYDFSEQQQVSCDTSMSGCRGGNMYALKYWYTIGPMQESCTRYCACHKPCSDLSSCSTSSFRTSDFHTIDTADINQIKHSIYDDGPAYFRFDVYSDFDSFWWNQGESTVYTQSWGGKEGGHAVLIIGWDDSKRAWICKNSWGTPPNRPNGTFMMAYSGHARNLKFGMGNVSVTR